MMTPDRPIRHIENIWMISREYDRLAGTGGVKDVCRQLAEVLVGLNKRVSVVLPLYGFMEPRELGLTRLGLDFEVDMNYVGIERRETVRIWLRNMDGVQVYLVDAARYREKLGIYTYTAEEEVDNPLSRQGTAYHDYFAMNVLLQKASLALMMILNERPDIIHCQDAHTALVPAMISECEGFRHYFRNTATVVTIHNAGYGYHQDIDDLRFAQEICGLSEQYIQKNLLDGKFNPFLASSSHAMLNTVSENYARELQETEEDVHSGWLGHRLLAKGVHLTGITNGINPSDFDPSSTGTKGSVRLRLPATFDPGKGDLIGKRKCKVALLESVTKDNIGGANFSGYLNFHPELPLFTMVGRLTPQKGVDVLVKALEKLMSQDERFQVIIQGTGAKEIEDDLVRLAEMEGTRGRICVSRCFDTDLANRIYAAGDFFLIPSRYEPCGLTDFIAWLAGNIPIVHHVGGLVKVIDGVSGFAYKGQAPEVLMAAMQRGLRVYRQKPEKIVEMQKTAVARINRYYTWDKVVDRYQRFYQFALEVVAGRKEEGTGATHRPRIGIQNGVLN